jgi:hypothetical protein
MKTALFTNHLGVVKFKERAEFNRDAMIEV